MKLAVSCLAAVVLAAPAAAACESWQINCGSGTNLGTLPKSFIDNSAGLGWKSEAGQWTRADGYQLNRTLGGGLTDNRGNTYHQSLSGAYANQYGSSCHHTLSGQYVCD